MQQWQQRRRQDAGRRMQRQRQDAEAKSGRGGANCTVSSPLQPPPGAIFTPSSLFGQLLLPRFLAPTETCLACLMRNDASKQGPVQGTEP